MLDIAEQPRLLITHKDTAQVYGVCSFCEQRLHAFIRNTEQQAMLLLNRGFKHHCRSRHATLVSIPTKISTPRRSTRIPTDVPIEVQGEGFAYAGEAITANLHGALVRMSAPLKVGDPITIHVHRTGKSAVAAIVFADHQGSRFGIELQRPENIWGVAAPPSDWNTASISTGQPAN